MPIAALEWPFLYMEVEDKCSLIIMIQIKLEDLAF